MASCDAWVKLVRHVPAKHVPLTCRHCGEIIGSYEPTIVREDGAARETSRASEPDLWSPTREIYHRVCYAAHVEPEDSG